MPARKSPFLFEAQPVQFTISAWQNARFRVEVFAGREPPEARKDPANLECL
jgi:hypothetical protein